MDSEIAFGQPWLVIEKAYLFARSRESKEDFRCVCFGVRAGFYQCLCFCLFTCRRLRVYRSASPLLRQFCRYTNSRCVRRKAGCGFRDTGPTAMMATTGFRASGCLRRTRARFGLRRGGDGTAGIIYSMMATGEIASGTTAELITDMDTWASALWAASGAAETSHTTPR